MGEHHSIMGGEGFKLIGGTGKRQFRDRGDLARNSIGKTNGGGETRAHRRAALGEFHKSWKRLDDAGDAIFNLFGIA